MNMDFLRGNSESVEGTVLKPVTGTKAKKYRESMRHIEGLKPGDKLRWKGDEYKIAKIPALKEIIEVFRVGEPGTVGSSGAPGSQNECELKDFTALFTDTRDGELDQYAFSSARFELVK